MTVILPTLHLNGSSAMILDPVVCRKLAREIQADLDSGPEVNPYEMTWGAASTIAAQLTAAAELGETVVHGFADQRAGAERVRSVVRDAAFNLLCQAKIDKECAPIAGDIADRVAAELAAPVGTMTAERLRPAIERAIDTTLEEVARQQGRIAGTIAGEARSNGAATGMLLIKHLLGAAALTLPDLVHLAELREYVVTISGLISQSVPQSVPQAPEDLALKPVQWIALIDRIMTGADSALVAEARATVKETLEARKRPQCPYGNMPRSAGAGHWRDWHRGHGCHLDPDTPKEKP